MSMESSSSSAGSTNSSSTFEFAVSPSHIKKMKISSSATTKELSQAIDDCKTILMDKDMCSDERLWLVRYIVELRLKLQELKEGEDVRSQISESLMGHKFKIQESVKSNSKQYCDHCSGVIWNIIQGSYICEDCEFVCHVRCINEVRRICVHVLITERGELEMNICPERGLDVQNYECAECKTPLISTVQNGMSCFGRAFFTAAEKFQIEPRLCDYSGLYYCTNCHWNDKVPIPARVVHNWDWEKRPVSRMAYQLLKISFSRPMIDLEKYNGSLVNFAAELTWVHKLRKILITMQQYLNTCQDAIKQESKLIRETYSHTTSYKYYSMAQLYSAKEGTLEIELTKLLEAERLHIMKCEHCYGQGYLCEMCPNGQVIFPFDSGAISCVMCNSLFHRRCWTREGQTCPKCKRIAERKLKNQNCPDVEEAIFVINDEDQDGLEFAHRDDIEENTEEI